MSCVLIFKYRTSAQIETDKSKNTENITSIEELNGRPIACLEGSPYLNTIYKRFPDSNIVTFDLYPELVEALLKGRVDAYIADGPLAEFQTQETQKTKELEGKLSTERYGLVLDPSEGELCDEVNAVLVEFREEGILEALDKKWMKGEYDRTIDIGKEAAPTGQVIKVAASTDTTPFSYEADGEMRGYEVELVQLIAKRIGAQVDIRRYGYATVISGITSGREDIAIGGLVNTKDRAETVLFTDTTYESGAVAIVLDKSVKKTSFLEELERRFERTFIRENRWKLLVNGLRVTIELSIFSLLFGTLAGLGYSFLLRSENKIIAKAASMISTVLEGLPQVITVMLLYYIIFAKTSLPAVWIGIIGFTLDFANVVAGLLVVGIDTVDKGEIEAAKAMGYKKWQVFTKIILPQTIIKMFSQYTGAVISLIKGTSVIGYITIQDLTKAGEVIRHRTYEAFFPLIVSAVIYFVLARIFVWLLSLFTKSLDPKRRKRIVRGVQIHD